MEPTPTDDVSITSSRPLPTSSQPSHSGRISGVGGGAPVNFLLLLHKAFRRELTELKRLAVELCSVFDCGNSSLIAEGGGGACGGGDRRFEVRSRVEFCRNVYKYHCAAEAEVLFLALDARVENIACTYYLQHYSTNTMFESVLSCLNGPGYSTQDLQELITHIGTLEDSICQHMVKEEKQVYPLLMGHFSDEEQASLVWQFMCSFPVMLLEDFFPWLASLLSLEEQLDLKDCISNILTRDKLTLHEIVIFWIDKAATQSQLDSCNKYGGSSESLQEQENVRDVSKFCLLENGPFDCLLLLHAAIKSDLEEILDKLDQAQLQKISSLSSLIIQIKFLSEVLIYYSDILEKIFYPLLEDSSLPQASMLYTSFPHKIEVGGLQKILYDADKIHESTFLESLCSQMECLVLATSEYLSSQETLVFPFISKNCNQKSQLDLLIRSLRMLPLGLLKCVVTWFSSNLPRNELKFILHGIGQSYVLDKPFASLLHDWFHAGYSGKSSSKNFEEILNRRAPFMSELLRDGKDQCKNLKLFSSRTAKRDCSFHCSPNEAVAFNFMELRPMDQIYYFFHKAIKKDLESLVLDITKLSKDSRLLMEFTQQFRSLRTLYELHSETEDMIAFPALEANVEARNVTQSYSIDHEMETQYFDRVSGILAEMSGVYDNVSSSDVDSVNPVLIKYRHLCSELEHSCKSLKKILEDHILREEIELWPMFREYFSIEEQDKILGYILGRTGEGMLQKIIVWLMAHLSLEEQQAMMNSWHRATYCTKFNEWLREWWESVNKYDYGEAKNSTKHSSTMDSVNIVSKRLSMDVSRDWRENFSVELLDKDYRVSNHSQESLEFRDMKLRQLSKQGLGVYQQNKHLVASQVEEGGGNKRVLKGCVLDLQASSKVIQNSTISIGLSAEPHPGQDVNTTTLEKIQGQFPSYRDAEGSVFGCKHYKQNCKLVASCCNSIFTCRRCHDETNDHVMDRRSITQMMCMRCLKLQPIGRTCSTPSCNEYSMARYYCRICRLFDDDREIYHCPYCNLCRVGKGLGIDYYHCMKCNACMSRYRPAHICIENSIEDKCPICQEDMFTSTNPIKSLQCGHVMHSTCFEDYTCMRYTCPICSKSLGDMQVYFGMLDAFLAEQKMPEEYRDQTQAILCNDCEKKGTASFHWLYHKCPYCGSYNTRLL